VHRDLKPANVLLAPDGPRVIDFGISRAVTDTRLTATGAIIGTLSYMSPEQVQALETGTASDTFSLGSVLAFAASGSAPFSSAPGAPSASVMFRIVHGEPYLGAVHPDVRGLVEACLAKDPRQRPDLGRVAAYSTAAAERLGLSPAAFWPPEVAKVIQAQQAALTAQIEALQVGPGPHVEGSWGGGGMAGASARHAAPASTGPPGANTWQSPRSPVTDPAVAGVAPVTGLGNVGGVGGPGGGIAAPGYAVPGGYAVPAYPGPARGTSRRGLLIGAGVGSIAVIGGAVGWALSARTTTGGPPTTGTGSTSLPTGVSLPTGQSLQKYYGAGTPRKAAWKYSTGNAIEANVGAGNGMVYVGSTDNSVYAVNSATGRRAWSYQSGSVSAAPEVVGAVVCLSTTEGHFYALRVSGGTRAWDVDTGVPAIYKRTWAADGGSVILTSDSAAPQAYDAATGAKGVSFSTQEPYLMALGAADGVLYALDALGVLYAFHTATGTEIWHKQLLSSDDPPGTGLTIDGGSIYVGTVSGALYKIDATNGQVLWTYHPGSGMESAVAVADGVVYLRDNNGTVHAVSAATSKQVWARTATATGVYGLAVAGGRVYYTTALALQALDAKSSAPVWAFTAPNNAELLSTPAVANGLVFIGCYDDGLYAIKA
jgi:outer membrane protein assembly factor BamB